MTEKTISIIRASLNKPTWAGFLYISESVWVALTSHKVEDMP